MVKKRGRSGEATRKRILDAAVETLQQEGFAEASSRAIAQRGGFNSALIFYHFGSLDELLLAALDRTSSERLERYRGALAEAETATELLDTATRLYTEDRKSGHMAVVAQMIAASIARPELAPAMVARMEPWIDVAEAAISKVMARLDLPEVIPLRELAYAFVTFYLGVNLLAHLDPEGERTDALFARAETLAPLLAALERAGATGN
jgi:AcrR family transcriptional regulator